MTDFLLELRSEEIPARIQDKARDDGDRPGRSRKQAVPRRGQEQRIDGKGNEEDSDLGQNRPDHDE